MSRMSLAAAVTPGSARRWLGDGGGRPTAGGRACGGSAAVASCGVEKADGGPGSDALRRSSRSSSLSSARTRVAEDVLMAAADEAPVSSSANGATTCENGFALGLSLAL
eukprot:4806676-Prymnesium_polylepis.2